MTRDSARCFLNSNETNVIGWFDMLNGSIFLVEWLIFQVERHEKGDEYYMSLRTSTAGCRRMYVPRGVR